MTVPVLRYRIVPTGTLLRSRILPSVPALQISLRVSGGWIQWRRGESGAWTNLIETVDLAPSALEILALLVTVDGAGSGLDADLLDGVTGADYLARANHTGTQLAATVSDFSAAADARIAAAVGVSVQAWDAQLDSLSAASANGVSLVTAANYAAMRALLDLEIGTDLQAWSANLDEYAAVNPTAAGLALLDDLDAAAQLTTLGLSANGQSLVAAANYAAMRGLLDLEAGTDFYSIAAANAAFQPIDADLTSWAGVVRAAGFDTFAATPSSANLAALVTGETGTGALVFATSPTLVTPALGTPASGVATNLTGTAAGLTAGNVTTNANLTGPVTSVGNATSLNFSHASIVTAAETIASNNNDTTIPTSAAVKAYADSVGGGGSASPPPRYPTLSNNTTDATNDLDITAGSVWDSTDAVKIVCAAMTKQLDANWAAGSAAGLRNSGAAIANTTYHIYAVSKAAGADPDYYAHTSLTVATVITALQAETGGASYIYAERIGSIVRLAGAIKAFVQRGKVFIWNSNAADAGPAAGGTTAALVTLTVPIGLRVIANVGGVIHNTGAANVLAKLSSVDQADATVDNTNCNAATVATGIVTAFDLHIMTNTSGQIRIRANTASTNFYIGTAGYLDYSLRGD